MLRVIVLLEGETSAQSEGLSTLDQVFEKDISVLQLFLNPDQSPSPCRWKTLSQHDAATTLLHRWDGIGLLMMLPPLCFTVGMVLGC